MTTASESVTPAPEVAATDIPEPPPGAAPEESPLPTLIGAVEEWLLSLRIAVARAVDLTVLETRLAALNFALILILAIGSGLLLATAWIALFAAIVALFHEMGLSWPAAFLLMAVINLGLAVGGGYAIYRMSNNMLFKAIRRFITYSERLYEEEPNAASRPAAGNTPPTP